MKVEKINENKVKISLTIDELKQRKINVKDIEKNMDLARNLFIDLIEESNLEDEFSIDDSQLYIEASSDNNNLFVVTITKIDHIPELSKYSFTNNKNINTRSKHRSRLKNDDSTSNNRSSSKNSKHNIKYKIDTTMYSFTSLDNILNMCEVLKKGKFYYGKNSLYKYANEYFLIFEKSSIKNEKFIKTFSIISEYCQGYYSYGLFDVSVKENCKLIIEDKALQKLLKI